MIVQPTYTGAPLGGQIWPSAWNNKGSYDPTTHRVILSDRWYDTTRGISIFGNGIYAYDPSANVFAIIKLNNWYADYNSSGGYTTTPLPANTTDPTPPDHHPLTSVEVIPSLNAVFTVNGVNSISLPDPSILDKTWKLDFGSQTWTMVSSDQTDPNCPPNFSGTPSGLVYDPVTARLVYLVPASCGCSGVTTYLFDPIANLWSVAPQDPSAQSVFVAGAGVAYDSKRNVVMAYGGDANILLAGTAHLWAYSASNNRWTQLADAPVSAMAPGFAYDSNHDVFMALVGDDTYIYNPNTNTWSQLPASLNRIAAVQNWQSITYDPFHDVFVFEGGNWSTPMMALFRYDPNSIQPDTTPPTVAMTAPANGAAVSGTVTVSANASDNVAVSKVQFQLDGAALGGPLTAGPYSISWDSTRVGNGSHTLSAVATDTSGNMNDVFYFRTQISSGLLQLTYLADGAPQFYWVPSGTEDTLFGSGVLLKVTIAWTGTGSSLYLNDTLVQSAAYTPAAPNWTSASNFDLGAYEYGTYGGYNASDDLIDEFTVYSGTR